MRMPFIVRRGEVLNEEALERLVRAGVSEVEVYSSATFVPLRGTYEDLAMRRDWSSSPQLAADVVAEDTGEVLAEKGARFDAGLFTELKSAMVREALVFTGGPRGESPLLRNTLAKDPTAERGRRASLHLLARPARRGAESGHCPGRARPALLQPEAVRSGPGGASQDQSPAQGRIPAARPRHAGGRPRGPGSLGFRRHHPLSGRTARRSRIHGRHRPSREPPRAVHR